MIKTAEQLVAEATAQIVTLKPAEALSMQQAGEAVLVDIRDIRELAREGKVPDAVHAPRGMLEFWVDPASKYHRDVFAQPGKTYEYQLIELEARGLLRTYGPWSLSLAD